MQFFGINIPMFLKRKRPSGQIASQVGYFDVYYPCEPVVGFDVVGEEYGEDAMFQVFGVFPPDGTVGFCGENPTDCTPIMAFGAVGSSSCETPTFQVIGVVDTETVIGFFAYYE